MRSPESQLSHHHFTALPSRAGEKIRHVGERIPDSGITRAAHGLVGAVAAGEVVGLKVIVSVDFSMMVEDLCPVTRSLTSKKEI
jgi:hypothetical protein